jgi:hypothetical protein
MALRANPGVDAATQVPEVARLVRAALALVEGCTPFPTCIELDPYDETKDGVALIAELAAALIALGVVDQVHGTSS